MTPTVPNPYPCYCDPTAADTKDPAMVRFAGDCWLYYSLAPREAGGLWDVGIARGPTPFDLQFVGTLNAMDPRGAAMQPGIAAPAATVIDGRIELFYQTYPGSPAGIIGAWSTDGIHFSRFGDDAVPLLRAEGEWNCRRAIDADVLRDGGGLLMYWATRDPGMRRQMVGVSRAPLGRRWDPAAWTSLCPDGPILAPQTPTALDPPGLDLAWEGECIEAPAAVRHGGLIYLFYGGGYNNAPQQIGVAVSQDGVRFRRLNGGRPILPNGPAGAWNASESGHPFVFSDADGSDILLYQGDNRPAGVTWRISGLRIDWPLAAHGEPVTPALCAPAAQPTGE